MHPHTHTHTHLAVSDEECCYDEAQDQWSQYHGVTELEEPHTQQAAHLYKVQSGHLENTHTHSAVDQFGKVMCDDVSSNKIINLSTC